MLGAINHEVLDANSWPVIRDRTAYIKQRVEGLDVLDVGCTGKKGDGRLPDHVSTLHHALRPGCRSLTGIDIDAKGIGVMQEAGYRVVCGDVTSIRLHQRFDVIVAAEVIEHLTNPGLALMNLKEHLKENGILLLTTCNPFYYRQQSRILRHGTIQVNNGHTCWYDPRTVDGLLKRCGLTIVKGAWLSPHIRWNLMTFITRLRKYWNANFLVEARPETPCPKNP